MHALEEITADAAAFRAAVAARQAYKPLYVKIKLIFGCNLRCAMCNHWRTPREEPLSHERLARLIDELAEAGCRKIHLTGGEPLLRAHLPELIAQADALGIRVNMTTNGTLVTKERARQLIEAGLRGVNLSIDSPVRKVHDAVRGVEGAWKKTTRAAGHFERYRHKGKLALRINTVVNALNYETLAEMPDLAHRLGADDLNLIGVDDHCGPALSLSRRAILDYNERIAPLIAARALELGVMQDESQAYPFGRAAREVKQAKQGQYALGYYQRHPCFAPWTHSLVDYNGLVYVCCMTREQTAPLGDLKTHSFKDVWEGFGYRVVRQMMHPPQLAMCHRCDDFLDDNRNYLAVINNAERGAGAPPLNAGVSSDR